MISKLEIIRDIIRVYKIERTDTNYKILKQLKMVIIKNGELFRIFFNNEELLLMDKTNQCIHSYPMNDNGISNKQFIDAIKDLLYGGYMIFNYETTNEYVRLIQDHVQED